MFVPSDGRLHWGQSEFPPLVVRSLGCCYLSFRSLPLLFFFFPFSSFFYPPAFCRQRWFWDPRSRYARRSFLSFLFVFFLLFFPPPLLPANGPQAVPANLEPPCEGSFRTPLLSPPPPPPPPFFFLSLVTEGLPDRKFRNPTWVFAFTNRLIPFFAPHPSFPFPHVLFSLPAFAGRAKNPNSFRFNFCLTISPPPPPPPLSPNP